MKKKFVGSQILIEYHKRKPVRNRLSKIAIQISSTTKLRSENKGLEPCTMNRTELVANLMDGEIFMVLTQD